MLSRQQKRFAHQSPLICDRAIGLNDRAAGINTYTKYLRQLYCIAMTCASSLRFISQSQSISHDKVTLPDYLWCDALVCFW